MKRLMTLMLALSFLACTTITPMFAEKKEEKTKQKGKKKKKKEEAPKNQSSH